MNIWKSIVSSQSSMWAHVWSLWVHFSIFWIKMGHERSDGIIMSQLCIEPVRLDFSQVQPGEEMAAT